MLDRLSRLVDDVAVLHSKLVVLVGPPRSGKTHMLNRLAERRGATVVGVGGALGRRLVEVPAARRPAEAVSNFRDLVASHAADRLVMLDNLEILFDRTLKLEPLDLLRRQAHLLPVLAAWPGKLQGGRLTYADIGHPERRDYGLDGVIPFVLDETKAKF